MINILMPVKEEKEHVERTGSKGFFVWILMSAGKKSFDLSSKTDGKYCRS